MIDCKTRNVIYVITCTRCKAQYVGITWQSLVAICEIFSRRSVNWVQICLEEVGGMEWCLVRRALLLLSLWSKHLLSYSGFLIFSAFYQLSFDIRGDLVLLLKVSIQTQLPFCYPIVSPYSSDCCLRPWNVDRSPFRFFLGSCKVQTECR